jgi:hypothetical protein
MTKKNQIDPTKFNMFKVENVDEYLGVQAFSSIFKSIQTPHYCRRLYHNYCKLYLLMALMIGRKMEVTT